MRRSSVAGTQGARSATWGRMSATGRRLTVSVSRSPASSSETTAAVEFLSSRIETARAICTTVALIATNDCDLACSRQITNLRDPVYGRGYPFKPRPRYGLMGDRFGRLGKLKGPLEERPLSFRGNLSKAVYTIMYTERMEIGRASCR